MLKKLVGKRGQILGVATVMIGLFLVAHVGGSMIASAAPAGPPTDQSAVAAPNPTQVASVSTRIEQLHAQAASRAASDADALSAPQAQRPAVSPEQAMLVAERAWGGTSKVQHIAVITDKNGKATYEITDGEGKKPKVDIDATSGAVVTLP